jgi:two-component system cell cycle sensor histidine kinase/response regulator CckA
VPLSFTRRNFMTEQPTSVIGRGPGRTVNPPLALAFFVVLAGAVTAFSFLPNDEGVNSVILVLVLLAIAGICVSFAMAAGLLRFPGQASRNDLAKLICDATTDGLILTSSSGKILYANDAYLSLAGASRLADCRAVERLFSGSPEIAEAIYRLAQAARNGRAAVEEVRLSPPLNAGGEAGWYKIKVSPLALASGRETERACLWSVADVTRGRERQEHVFQELRHAIDFLDHAPAGFFSCRWNGDVTYMNATLAGWLGYDPAESGSGGLKLTDFVVRGGSALTATAPGRAGGASTEQFDVELKRRDGQTLPAHLLHSVVYGQDGVSGPSRTLVLNRTLAENVPEDPSAASARFTQAFDATPMAIAILDKSGRITRSNAAFARLMPESLKQSGGAARTIFAGILDRDNAALESAIAAAFQATPDIAPVDVGLKGEGDRSARLFVSAAEEHDGNGATIYALDTTEQRTLQSNFAQSQKMQAIGQLAGGVAHDFNNVLTAIIGYSDLLLANHRPTDPSFQDINQIKQNANRAASLVRQLLAFSRRQTLRPQVLQLGDVLSDLQMLMRRLVGEKIDLELRHGRDLWLVEADVNQFEHVLVNLIVNARDAMPQGGKIILRTRNVTAAECAGFSEASLGAADYVAIEVEDFGHGIPPEVRDKIFEPFFTTKEVGKGTGLGLAMVYGIVKQTGGYVFCSSTVGKGTVFTILLPRYIPDETQASRSVEQVAAPSPDLTGHGTILLVEDEEAVRAFGARALASRGYTVLQAASGIEALEIVEQNGGKIDLVVSDVVMPEMDGPTMFGELRKRGIKARVIFVSGYAEDAFAKNLPEGEDFGFLPKPFSLKQLIEAVKGKQ